MTHDQLIAAERALEQDAVEAGIARYRDMLAARGGENTAPGQRLMRRTIGDVVAGITEWQQQATDGTPGRNVGLAKFLAQYDAEEVAFITLRHVVGALHRTDAKLVKTAMLVVSDLEAIDLEARLKKADRQLFNRYVRIVRNQSIRQGKRMSILKSQGEYVGVFSAKAGFAWTDSQRLQVGVRLLEIVEERTNLFEKILSTDPADAGKHGDAAYFLAPTEQTQRWLETAHAEMDLTRPTYYPMVVPPVDWTDNEGGGYLSQARGFKRSLVKVVQGTFRAEVNASAMPKVTAAINALQRVPFTVNEGVLKVVEANIAAGSSTGLPTQAERRPLPARHAFMDEVVAEDWTDDQRAAFKSWKRATSEAKEHNNRTVSEARTTATTAEIGRKMMPFPAIYFPVQLDFRGRAYPVPSYLQPQGSDLAKGLLQFADAKPLGTSGMRWLAVHLANCFGGDTKLDKQAFDVRVRWVRENHAEIVADAEDPGRVGAMWPKADAPFQFLAGCFEWHAMAQHAARTGSVESFESRLPVGLDGSCNGLQHFSAMLRDPVGGRATNLVPSERPSDIYSLVADEVRKAVEMDLAADDAEVVQFARFWMTKGITRKWTKRNTMTLPYGVTRQGMKDQLWAEIGRGKQREFFAGWEIDHGKTVSYLATQNWIAIGKVVIAAREAMDWIQQVARGATKAGAPVMWTTDDGLPVMQRYCQRDEIAVKMFGNGLKLILRPFNDKLNGQKQAMALAPNFVHSVDAAHMRAVTRRLTEMGITSMSMVHDSFAVHAGHVETLAEVIRQEFVALHSKPLLQQFFDGVAPSLSKDHEVPPVPAAGALDLTAVLQADYFFA
jgi:DNA-directed RNA polymerase, mitochondrial